jgi:hypothetical protein
MSNVLNQFARFDGMFFNWKWNKKKYLLNSTKNPSQKVAKSISVIDKNNNVKYNEE